jgi:hypothetical protein
MTLRFLSGLRFLCFCLVSLLKKCCGWFCIHFLRLTAERSWPDVIENKVTAIPVGVLD